MSIRTYSPTSASRRNMTNLTFDEITKSTPEKSLTVKLSKTGGRNNQGVITTRHIGGGHKRRYRVIDFKRNKDGIVGTIKAVEYDPNRNANILLVVYADGEKRYILAPQGLKVGDKVVSGENVDIKPGNAMPLKNMPKQAQMQTPTLHLTKPAIFSLAPRISKKALQSCLTLSSHRILQKKQ